MKTQTFLPPWCIMKYIIKNEIIPDFEIDKIDKTNADLLFIIFEHNRLLQ